MRLVPIVFGLGAIIGLILVIKGIYIVMKHNSSYMGYDSIIFVIFCACIPFAAYVSFTVVYLLIDILYAIASLPRRLDELIQATSRPGGRS